MNLFTEDCREKRNGNWPCEVLPRKEQYTFNLYVYDIANQRKGGCHKLQVSQVEVDPEHNSGRDNHMPGLSAHLNFCSNRL